MSDPTRLSLIILLILGSAFFSMTEGAFSYCNQIRMKISADEGSKSAKLVLKCLNKFDNYIITNLIGNNIVNILISVFTTVLCINLIIKSNLQIENPSQIGAVISTIIATIVVFFFGEIIPKSLGKSFPNAICKVVVYPLILMSWIFFPISLVFKGLLFVIKKIFNVKDDEPLFDEKDFQHIVGNIEKEGLIEEEERNIIQSAVDFDDAKVKQVMRPKENILALDIDKKMDKDQLVDYILDNPYTRIPVYKGSINNIIGILHTQKLLKAIMNDGTYDIEKLLVEPIFVKPNVHLDTLFEEFKKRKTHIAIVKDKEENTIGIVTMEDLIEQLVGDIDESHEGGEAQ